VAAQRDDASSILHLYRRVLGVRRTSPALRAGSLALRSVPDGVLAYERACGPDRRLVLVNFTEAAVVCPVAGAWRVDVASDAAGEGAPYAGRLGPNQAVIAAAIAA
jgi:alpha-glucosidase